MKNNRINFKDDTGVIAQDILFEKGKKALLIALAIICFASIPASAWVYGSKFLEAFIANRLPFPVYMIIMSVGFLILGVYSIIVAGTVSRGKKLKILQSHFRGYPGYNGYKFKDLMQEYDAREQMEAARTPTRSPWPSGCAWQTDAPQTFPTSSGALSWTSFPSLCSRSRPSLFSCFRLL